MQNELEPRSVPPAAIALWILATLIIFLPGGTYTQIDQATKHFAGNVAASPLGKLCYECNRPAVQAASYDDGSVRYFCSMHAPPQRLHRDPGEHGQNKFDPQFCRYGLALFLGIGWSCIALGLANKTNVTVKGALIGVAISAALWMWFSQL